MIRLRHSGNKTYAEVPLSLSDRERESLLTIAIKDAKFNALPLSERLADFRRRRPVVENQGEQT